MARIEDYALLGDLQTAALVGRPDAVRLIDFMPPRDGVVDLVRIVEGVRGEVRLEMDLALRFDYGHVVPWGLLSEEYGTHARRHLGNTPQAFSHFGLINAALALHRGTPASDQPPA